MLTTSMIPSSEYYAGKILEYKILQHPVFGTIKSGKSKVNRFTHKQLEQGHIRYIHDGSENSTDSVRLIAIARNKESIPFNLTISINPVNDEVPIIITNAGLQMWIGGKSLIKSTNLRKIATLLYLLHNKNILFLKVLKTMTLLLTICTTRSIR